MKLLFGDCLELLPSLAENSMDSCVTDPPYELGFMAKKWDKTGIAYRVETWAAVLRVLKPGAHLLTFGGTRTHHRMVCAIEDAGFEIRDEIDWVYGQGFPKSLNFEDGWGTALKPAKEPICLARKPLVGTVEANRAAHGTGGINIDGCRVGTNGGCKSDTPYTGGPSVSCLGLNDQRSPAVEGLGRWPANVIHDGSDEVLSAFPDAPGRQRDALNDGSAKRNNVFGVMKNISGRDGEPSADSDNLGEVGFKMKPGARRLDSGSAARFFYCSKATKSDREEGCAHLPEQTAAENVDREPGSAGMDSPRAGAGRTNGRRNHHPTVKPTDLMRYLCRLITPVGGTVLDPFMGSGSTGKAALLEGFDFIGIEKDPGYGPIAKARIWEAAGI